MNTSSIKNEDNRLETAASDELLSEVSVPVNSASDS
jgi:hypothetical protein